jgi:hypothetical protein
MLSLCSDLENSQISESLQILLEQQDDTWQFSENVTFIAFVKFFVRFGSQDNILDCVHEIRNKDWFFPSSDKGSALERLAQLSQEEAWIVMLSKKPHKFTLLFRDTQAVLALHVVHDAMAMEKKFVVEFIEGRLAFQPTLRGILVETLGLTDRSGRGMARQEAPKYVKAVDFIRRKGSGRQMNQKSQSVWDSTWDGSVVQGEDSQSVIGLIAPDSQFEFSQIEILE